MSEIEKMYENAGIKKVKDYYCPNCETKLEDWFGEHKEYICPNERCDYALCDDEEDFQECLEHLSYREKYPPFTAEKQLKIMELLVKKGMLLFTFSTQKNYKVSGFCRGSDYCSDINEALANYINNIWQDLTEQEKQQVKGILE